MKYPKSRALSMYKFWLKRCQDAGISKSELRKIANEIANKVANNSANTKEEEEGKRENPPYNPSKERREEEGENNTPPPARAYEDGDLVLPPVIDIHKPPTLPLLLAFAKKNGFTNTDYCRKWFDTMSNQLFWCHPKTGNPLEHWPAYFRRCYLDDNKSGKAHIERNRRHADNWRPTDKEDLDDVLG